MRKAFSLLMAGMIASTMLSAQTEMTELTTSQLTGTYKYSTSNISPYGIHDPSVVWDSETQTFYVYGSHYASATTTNLRNWTENARYYVGDLYDNVWTGEYNTYKAFLSNPEHTVKRCLPGSTVEEEVTLGSFNAAEFCSIYASSIPQWVSGDQWAPDIIYNPHMGKWCLYLSLNGDNWASVVVLMTSDNPKGPFTYEAPIVFGGFNNNSYSGKKVDYKNTDLEIVLGEQASLPSRYNVTTHWGTYYPNCIDPCVFFDEEGELWIAYGSWSGGIWMLKLDKQTGLRDYTYTYSGTGSTASANATSDAYFGKKIAGGYYSSGEGPYIQHIGNYYYLFMSYGGFAPDGGYEMRLFRSSKPTGPYVDASGTSAIYSRYELNYGPRAITDRGVKLLGAYNGWGLETRGECAQGHNSACQDDQGRTYVVYHTKFNYGDPEKASHAMRVRQLFLNENGWLVAAPFEFNGETLTDADIATTQPWTAEDIEGDYQLLIHPYKLDHSNYQEATPVAVHLSADGRVTGDQTGTWKYSKDGASYIQIKLGSTTYFGVVSEQTLQGSDTNLRTTTASVKTLCFSAVAASGVPVWGYKWQPQYAIAYNYNQHTSDAFRLATYSNVKTNVEMAFAPAYGVELQWTSSNPDLLSETGKYNPTDQDETVELNARLSAGRYFWTKNFNATVKAATEIIGDPYSGVVAYYNFDAKPTKNVMNESQSASYTRSSTSATTSILKTDYARFGMVAHVYQGDLGNNSVVRMPNPLKDAADLEGFTVSMWVKRYDTSDYYNAFWSFFNSVAPASAGARLYFTGNSYLGFNDGGENWFDVNHPNEKKISQIDGNWRLITVTYSQANGYMIYRDGSKYISTNLKYTGSVAEAEFDRSLVTNFVSEASYFYLGNGSFWGSAEADYDDLLIYDRELTADDVKGLYTALTRVNAFNSGTITGIDEVAIEEQTAAPEGIYDLMGRKVSVPGKGIYIVNGKKTLFR